MIEKGLRGVAHRMIRESMFDESGVG